MQVSEQALIREMDADEVIDYMDMLAGIQDISGKLSRLVRLCREQYRQLTGRELAIDSPGMTISGAAMLMQGLHHTKQTA